MTLNLRLQASADNTLPAAPVRVYCGSALALDLLVPHLIAGVKIAALSVSVTNADGTPFTADATEQTCGWWSVTFAASCFGAYGTVTRGVKITATISPDDGITRDIILAIGDLDILPADATSRAGEMGKSYISKGDDVYIKSYVDSDGVQHFLKQVMSYDEDMAAWGADWQGDYILVDAAFVPAESTTDNQQGA